MSLQRIARRYAKALLGTALQREAADTVEQDLAYLVRVTGESADLRMLFRSPVIEATKKKDIVREIFTGKVSELTLDFVSLLMDKGREGDLLGVAQEYMAQYDVHRGVLRITVTSAVALSDAMQADVADAVGRRTGKKIVATYNVDPKLLAGVSVRVGDLILDSSLHHQLDLLRQRLSGGDHAPSMN